MIVIEINKTPTGHYKVEMMKSINNHPSTNFKVIETARRFDTAMLEARKLARSHHKEGHDVHLRIFGGSKHQNGRFTFGADRRFHRSK